VSVIIRRPKGALATPTSTTPSTTPASITPPSTTPASTTPPSTTRPSATTSTGLPPKGTKLLPTRRQRREDTAKELAHVIKEVREAGHHSNAEIAKCLNERGLRAPSGGLFSPETTRRILNDIKRLGLGHGPRTVSQALTDRHRERREREKVELDRVMKEVEELKAQRRREHPDWPQTRPWLR
jgi:hypothetical protein